MLQGLLCNSKCGTDPCPEAEFDRCWCEIWISHVISKTNANIVIKKTYMLKTSNVSLAEKKPKTKSIQGKKENHVAVREGYRM